MRKLILILSFISLAFSGCTQMVNPYVFDGILWQENTDILSGLNFTTDDGQKNQTTFYIGSDLYLIMCEVDKSPDPNEIIFKGYKWSGSTWAVDTDIVDGLDATQRHDIEVFYIDTDLYAIAAPYFAASDNDGYKWSGSTWAVDTDIVDGITAKTSSTAVSVFYIGTDLYLIKGNTSTNDGYKWSGSTWAADTDIVDGIPDVSSYASVSPIVIGGETYLVVGGASPTIAGALWNGSGWDSNDWVVTGITEFDNNLSSSIFTIGSDTYLIIMGLIDPDIQGYKAF